MKLSGVEVRGKGGRAFLENSLKESEGVSVEGPLEGLGDIYLVYVALADILLCAFDALNVALARLV